MHFIKSLAKKDNELRILKVFEEPIINFFENRHLDVTKHLSKYQDDRIVKAYETGYLEYNSENFFFCILEFIEGKSLDKIPSNIFWEKNQYKKRIKYKRLSNLKYKLIIYIPSFGDLINQSISN